MIAITFALPKFMKSSIGRLDGQANMQQPHEMQSVMWLASKSSNLLSLASFESK